MRLEFNNPTKRAAHKRSGGFCECHLLAGLPGFNGVRCGVALNQRNGTYYEHINQAFVRDDNSLENCAVLTRTCWRKKTDEIDRPVTDRVKQRIDRNINIKRSGHRPMPGSRASGWRHKLNGQTERR